MEQLSVNSVIVSILIGVLGIVLRKNLRSSPKWFAPYTAILIVGAFLMFCASLVKLIMSSLTND